jgi:hypothetical protein
MALIVFMVLLFYRVLLCPDLGFLPIMEKEGASLTHSPSSHDQAAFTKARQDARLLARRGGLREKIWSF